MKIQRIRFKNINSFYGEHQIIDFTKSPLAETGLFIITGATGAGKSTLLDVITLALFNRVPRLGDISKSSIENLGSIINQKASDEPKTDAYAEVEYEVKNKQYRSKWLIQKNRNGNWNNYSMEIAELPSENLLEIKNLKDFPRKNEELIGLTAQQFVQSIILAQGNFAEFLKASKNERGKLLEDITGTTIYREIGKKAFEKNKILKENIDRQTEILKNFNLLSEEDTEKKKQDLENLNRELESVKQELKTHTTQHKHRNDLEKAQKHIAEIEKEQESLKIEQEKFKDDAERLQRHEQISGFASEMTSLQHYQKSLREWATTQQNLAEQYETLENKTNALFKTAGDFTKQGIDNDNFQDKLNDFYELIAGFNDKIRDIDAEVKPIFESIKREIRESSDDRIKNLNPTAIDDNLAAIRTIAETLEDLNTDINIADLKTLDEQKTLSKELEAALKKQSDCSDKGKNKNQIINNNKDFIETQQPILGHLLSQITEKNAALKNLNEEKNKRKTEIDLDKLREGLVPDEPCPLCGSVQHPYVQHYVNLLGEVELKITAIEKTLKTLDENKNDTEKAINSKITANQMLETEVKDLRSEYQEEQKKCKELIKDLELNEDIDTETLGIFIRDVEQKRAYILKTTAEKALREQLSRLATNYLRLADYRASKNELKENRQEYYVGENIKTDCDALKEQFIQLNNDLKNNQKEQATLNSNIAKTQKEAENLQSNLLKKLQARKINDIATAQKYLLAPTEAETLKKQYDTLTQQANDHNKDLETFRKQQEEANQLLTTELSLEDLEQKIVLCGNQQDSISRKAGQIQQELKTQSQNQQHLANQQSILADLQQKQQKWHLLNDYIGDANGNKFSTFAQGLTLNNLIGLANQRLKELSDRYLLGKPKAEEDSLFVFDGYQGNAERSVQTLSGGETFTISLALALALSDLASQNVRLDSLFIDEGFGTLDPDTLEVAISTLEKIQHDNQKMIGVISHRQEMKDRIGVQIQIEKGVDGTSKVLIASH